MYKEKNTQNLMEGYHLRRGRENTKINKSKYVTVPVSVPKELPRSNSFSAVLKSDFVPRIGAAR